MSKKGIFLSFEGGEGAGKSTVMDQLQKVLLSKNIPFFVTREPGGTAISEEIRLLVLHHKKDLLFSVRSELFLFLASRAQHVEEKILPALQEGKVILCDRFMDSSIAYQGFARGLGMEEVEKLSLFASQGCLPNATLYLDLDPRLGFERIQKGQSNLRSSPELDRMESETLSFHQKVRKGFFLLAEKYPQRIRVIDGSLPLEEVVSLARAWLEELLLRFGYIPKSTSV